MNAVVLCAGLGTRLRPLTEQWPKPALPLLGQPLLRYTLAVLKAGGVQAVAINTHHLPERMEAVAQAECARAGLPLTVAREPVIQGTGGGIRDFRALLSRDDFVVFNGDVLFPLDLEPVLADHRASGAAATMVLMPMPRSERYAAVEMDADGCVRRIAGHGPGGSDLRPWHFTGVHVIDPKVLDFMSPSGPEDINRDVYPKVIAAGLPVRGYVVQSTYWSDVGTPARYLQAQEDLLTGRVDLERLGDASPFLGAERIAGGHARGAVVEGRVVGPAFLDGCRIDAGAEIHRAVYVGPGARVGPGAKLVRAAVLEGTQVAPNEALAECIAWGPQRLRAT